MSNAVERYTPSTPDITDREWNLMEKKARVLAASSVVPKDYRGKPDDIMAVALTARDLGLDLTVTTLAQFFVVEGRCTPSAQLMIGMAAQHGHEVWVESSDGDQATVGIKRRGSEREHRFTFTLDMAKRANLTGKDNWKKYAEAMLIYRAATRGLRAVCPEVLLGLPPTLLADEPPEGVDADTGEIVDGGGDPDTPDQPAGDIVDAELVGDGDVGTPGDAPAAAAPPEARAALREEISKLGDEWAPPLKSEWRRCSLPSLNSDQFTVDHLAAAHGLVEEIRAQKADMDERRRHAGEQPTFEYEPGEEPF